MADRDVVYVVVRYRWWYEYLFVPVLLFVGRFHIDYIDADAEYNEEWLARWVERGIYLERIGPAEIDQ